MRNAQFSRSAFWLWRRAHFGSLGLGEVCVAGAAFRHMDTAVFVAGAALCPYQHQNLGRCGVSGSLARNARFASFLRLM